MIQKQIQETDAFQKISNEISEEPPTERLRELGSELLAYLFHEDSFWRRKVSALLGVLQEKAFWSYPALLEQLSKESTEAVTLSIVRTLGALHTPNEEITEQLLGLWQNTPIAIVRKTIVEALGTSGTSAALPVLGQALQDEYLAPSAIFALYGQGLEGARLLEEQRADWWEWALQTGQEKAALDKNLSAEVIERLSVEAPPSVQRKLANHHNLSEETLIQFATSPDPVLRQRLAANHQASLIILQELSLDPHENVRRGVAKNAMIPPEIIELLLQDDSRFVRWQLASNPAIDEALLHQFVTSESVYARHQATRNPKISAEALSALAKDTAPEVRASVASSRLVPQEVLASLVQDISPEVRRRAILNPILPEAILEQLADQEETKSRLAEAVNLPSRLRLQLAKDPAWEVRYAIASSEKTPAWMLRMLAKDTDAEVRRNVALHNSTPEDALALLARSEDDNIRDAVARNNTTPESLLKKLADDPFELVRGSLGNNPSLPPYLLEKLMKEGTRAEDLVSNPNTPIALLYKMDKALKFANPKLPLSMFPSSVDQLPSIARWNLASHTRTPVRLLEQISKQKEGAIDSAIRVKIARNENTPEYVLLGMTEDNQTVIKILIQQQNIASSIREGLLQKLEEVERQEWLCKIG
jgi:hypothetical protein